MSASNKLSTAVKALYFLAESYPEPKSSSEIASAIGYNPSKLRKILSFLTKSKIVGSTRGKFGGFLLSKGTDEINLQEIYCSVEFRKAFYLDVTKARTKSNYNQQFNKYFLNLFSEVQVEIENKMSQILLSDVINKIKIDQSK
jgi:Rrf2 family transcriptional repressor of oqxAB